MSASNIPPPLPRATPPPLPRAVARPVARAQGPRLPPSLPLPALDLSLLADLPSLTLQARYLIEGFLSGRHRSPQKGSSVEFAEYRDYLPGDDLRRVDWRLYGRTDRLHVRQYEEETQLRAFLVLDTSGSMDFTSRSSTLRKIEFARIVLAGLGLLAQRQGDAFGLACVGRELTDFLRARSSVPHWRSFVGKLETIRPGGPSRLAATLESLAEMIPRRSMILIASDFYEDSAPLAAALRRLRYDRHDLIGLHVLDPVEMDFDLDSSGNFIDVETGGGIKLDASSVRKGYLAQFGAFCAELDDTFRSVGGEVARLRTDRPPLEALTRYLARREEKR